MFIPNLYSTAFNWSVCSCEHESVFTAFMGADIAQVYWQTVPAGAELMEPTLKTLKVALETIRDAATNALTQAEQAQ